MRAARSLQFIQTGVAPVIDEAGSVHDQLGDEIILGPKIVVQRRSIPLPSGGQYFPYGHPVHAPRGEQALSGALDAVPGKISFHGLTVYLAHER